MILALVLALALVAVAKPQRAGAVAVAATIPTWTAPTITADGTNTLTLTDGGFGAGTDFAILAISNSSVGTAGFAAAALGQSLVVFNGTVADTSGGPNGTIAVLVVGLGTAGAVIVDIQTTHGVFTGTVQAAYTQTAALASVAIFTTATNIPVTAVAGVATTAAVLTARVLATTGVAATAGTNVTWQAVGQGTFVDSITAAEVIAAVLGGGAYDGGAANNEGCSAGVTTQSCTSATEFADDGEVIATAEPPGSGFASVHFEGQGVAGPTVITARAGGVTGPTSTINLVVFGVVTQVNVARIAAGVLLAGSGTEFLAILGVGQIIVTALDAANQAVTGFVPIFAVLSPTAPGAPAGLAGAANGIHPSCAAGTGALGTCNITVTATAVQGLNTVFVGTAAFGTPGVISAQIDFTVVGANATLTILDAPASVEAGSQFTVTVEVLDAAGVAAADGQVLVPVATGTGAIIPTFLAIAGGQSVITLIAGEVEGELQLVVVLGALQDSATIAVTGGTISTPTVPDVPAGPTDTTGLTSNTGFAVWTSNSDTTADALLSELATLVGGTILWKWTGAAWIFTAIDSDGNPVPNSVNFAVVQFDLLFAS